MKRGRFELKSQCFATKKGVIFKLETKDGYHFFYWVREPGVAALFLNNEILDFYWYTIFGHVKINYFWTRKCIITCVIYM